MDSPGVRQVTEGRGEQEKMEETDCEITCGALTTLAVKGTIRGLEVNMKPTIPQISRNVDRRRRIGILSAKSRH